MTGQHESQDIRVLLVEDDRESGDAMRVMLERREVQTTFVKSGEAALAIFSDAAFDIVVADIRMPDMTGVDLLREIKSRNPEFPFILITGYDDLGSAIEAVRLKADDYILKPMDRIEDLLIPVQKAVKHHRTLLRNRAMELEMRESRRKLDAILSSMNDLVFVLDAEQRFVLHRSDGKVSLYRTPKEFLGKTHGEVMPPDVDRQFQEAFNNARGGKMTEYEYSLKHAGGPTEHWLAKVTPMMEDGKFTGVVCVTRDITERKEAQCRLQRMAAQLCRAEEKERRSLALALHESVQQVVVSAKSLLDRMIVKRRKISPESLLEVSQCLDQATKQIRSLTFDCYPPALYSVGLKAALKNLADRMASENELHVEIRGVDVPVSPGEETKAMVFSMVRELLRNVVKHARASKALVTVSQKEDLLCVEVRDDGQGFDPNNIPMDGFGLFSIRERLRAMGGKFTVNAEPGQGTAVSICVRVESFATPTEKKMTRTNQ